MLDVLLSIIIIVKLIVRLFLSSEDIMIPSMLM